MAAGEDGARKQGPGGSQIWRRRGQLECPTRGGHLAGGEATHLALGLNTSSFTVTSDPTTGSGSDTVYCSGGGESRGQAQCHRPVAHGVEQGTSSIM
jgi:hypothetical protein